MFYFYFHRVEEKD